MTLFSQNPIDPIAYTSTLQRVLDYRWLRKMLLSDSVSSIILGPLVGLFSLAVMVKNQIAGALLLCFGIALLVNGVVGLAAPQRIMLVIKGILSVILGSLLLYQLSGPARHLIIPRPMLAVFDAFIVFGGLLSIARFKSFPKDVRKPSPDWERHAEEVINSVKQSNSSTMPSAFTFEQRGLNPGKWKGLLYDDFVVFADSRGYQGVAAARDQVSVTNQGKGWTPKNVRVNLVVRGKPTMVQMPPEMLDRLAAWEDFLRQPSAAPSADLTNQYWQPAG